MKEHILLAFYFNHWSQGLTNTVSIINTIFYYKVSHNQLFFHQVIQIRSIWDFPGGPVVKASPSNAGGAGLIPGQGAKIPHALWPKKQNIKQKQYCFIKNSIKSLKWST